MKLFITPDFGDGVDQGDGGIRRVVEAQRRYLPEYDIEIVDDIRQAEVVNCHIAPSMQDDRYLQQFTDVPYVVSSHGMYFAEYEWVDNSGRPIRWYLEANEKCMEAIRRADAVTGPSEWVAQAIRRNSLRPAVAVYHGVDPDEWQPVADEGYVLWNKTRVDPVCDPEPVNRLALLAPKVPFRTTFGRAEANVTVTGRLPYLEAKNEVSKAWAYLCTTRETFGIGTLEAMAAGVPVLGWRWGGQTEIIKHKQTGWLVTPGDYDGLVEGLNYIREHHAEMSEAARQDVLDRWTWPHVIGGYVDVFRQTIETKRSRQPAVSIVIRAYNLERYLPDAIQSVRDQNFADWECIIVDDASPDRCGAIADEIAALDGRFKAIHNKTNQHLAGSHNVGCGASTGKFIMALDADDTFPPNAVRVLAEALEQDRSIHIAYGNVEFESEKGERSHSGWPPGFRGEWQLRRGEGERPPNLVPYSAMYRREVWELTGGYRRRYRNAEDADFWARATSYGFRAKMVTDADTLRYRIRPDGMSQAEPVRDWLAWYPWTRENGVAPAAIAYDQQVPVPSFEPAQISVIVPVGPGHEEPVIDALDSIDAQTFRLWECIVVNDTGKPLPYVPAWAKVVNNEARFRIHDGAGHSMVDMHVPMGVGMARNLGIAASTAKLFVPLDADDTLEPTALARFYEVHKQFGGYVYSDWHELWADKPQTVWTTKEYNASDLPRGCIHAVTALYLKSDWERVGHFDESVAWEDWDFQLKLANVGVCGTRIPEPLFTYRKETGRRREENMAEWEKSKEGILAKWKPYFTGEQELMACRTCGSGGGRVPSTLNVAQTFTANKAAAPSDDFVIVEYTGDNQGTVTYRGPSKQSYNFAAQPGERQKAVLWQDAEFFSLRPDFRIVQMEQPIGANG